MLKRRTLHRDMADVNVYTARRLKSMALSLGGLAQAFADEIGGQGHLTKEDGLAAMQTAASAVCGDCTRCNLYYGNRRDDSYYLYYLLRTFEQKGKIDLEDMPRLFHEICSQREAYLRELNRSLGRATMNLGWKNRFLESRDAVIVQFRELAAILEEFSNQMEQASDVTASWEEMLSGILRRSHLRVDNMLVLQYENQQKEAFLTLRSVNGRCMTARDVAELLGRAIAGSHWSVAKDSKSLITRNAATFRFVEEGKYRMVYGMACSPREGEPISGDTCTVQTGLPGQVIMSLSDGMGSGRSASEDSEKVIELTQRLLETGFSARSALKLVNTVLLLAGTEQNPATIDLCCIDLGTGVLEAMKLGAVPTFILGREGVEFLEAGGLPIINWSVDTEDWKYRDAEHVKQVIVEQAGDGDVVLMHDLYPTSVKGALAAIDELQARTDKTYAFVTVSQLAAIHGITLEPGVVYNGLSSKVAQEIQDGTYSPAEFT